MSNIKTTCYNCLKYTDSKTSKICHYSKLFRIKKKSIKDTLFFTDITFDFFLSISKKYLGLIIRQFVLYVKHLI